MQGLMIRKAITMSHTLAHKCLACENMDLMCSFHHHTSLMLMVTIHEPLRAHMVVFKHMYCILNDMYIMHARSDRCTLNVLNVQTFSKTRKIKNPVHISSKNLPFTLD